MHTLGLRPTSQQYLVHSAEQLCGLTLAEVAQTLQVNVPKNLRRNKGWIGQLLELALGASAGSKPEQDFPELGVELKTIPVNDQGKPLETTFVSVAPLTGISGLRWQDSNVRNKLSCVLWIPIIGERHVPPGERVIGPPLLWHPSSEEERLLQQDWEEIMELISLGHIQSITARHGQVLQLRPKAANSKALTEAIGAKGQPILTLPRGFYLKTNFTGTLLAKHFML
ncbi:DNA mismatch repair endonuclease MutH [Oceanisphaera avium]|uniref:DNA mismatch repair protein MutH n=1 Tax=Oceanisphaera avium TaxID=1903694 RepID=A0A1Y0CYI1_9GAMM|nr:DNA mismatch repair endonuclease MutH [Oceanisphaera avium]ART80074.1 DNA mismatch repair endonuclease MutH [Oceanisphaera avium]